MPTSPYQVYSAGQRIQQGPGNRYIPPTYNYRNNNGSADYSQMDWNNVQSYNLPQQQNNPYQQEYMSGLRGALSGFGQRYPQQGPQMPQFGGRGGRREAYDYTRQQPWFDQENYGGGVGGRPSMPNFQGDGGMGGWQQMLQDFFSRMNQQQQGGQQKPEWTGGSEGAVKPGPNAPQATDPYAKIGYRG